jgi:hypothetical protein
MMDTTLFFISSLMVASFTLSHLVAIVFMVDEADDASSASMVWLDGVSLERIQAGVSVRVNLREMRLSNHLLLQYHL